MDKKSLDIIVEEFFDTGKLVLKEDIEFNVEDEDFGKEEGLSDGDKKGIQKIEDIINQSNTTDDLIDNLPTHKGNLWREDNRWNKKYWSDDNWLEKIKNYFNNNIFIKIYLDLLSIGKHSWSRVVRYSRLYQKIIRNEEIELSRTGWFDLKTHFKSDIGKLYLYNSTGILSEKEKEKISSKLSKDRNLIKLKDDNYYIQKIKNYLSKEKIGELPSYALHLLQKLFEEKVDIPNDRGKIKKFFINNLYGKLKEEFKGDININFYLDIIAGVKKIISRKNSIFTWNTIYNRQKTLFEIINNQLKEKPPQFNFINTKDIFKKIIDKEIPYIFSENGILNKDDEDIIKDYIENTYESTFTELGFSKRDELEIESRIHTLPTIKYNLTSEIISDKKDSVIAKELIKNIKSTLKENPNIIKYDLVADKDFYDKSGEVIINKGSKIEVKDTKYSDSYFAEMLASPVKQTDSIIRDNPKYSEKYNKIITEVFKFLQKYEVNLPTQFKNQLSGMILSNNIYVPNIYDNIELYLSPQGRNNIKKQIRVAVRYRINMNNINNFYRIGDGMWEISDNIKSEPGVMYPLTDNTLLSGVEKDKVENIPDSIEESITNFFDTGNFEF